MLIQGMVAHGHTTFTSHTTNNTSLHVGSYGVSIGKVTAVEVEPTANFVYVLIVFIPATVTDRTGDGSVASARSRGGRRFGSGHASLGCSFDVGTKVCE